MTAEEFDAAMETGSLDDQYWEFITSRGAGEILLDEDSIFNAMESGRYYDSFREFMTK